MKAIPNRTADITTRLRSEDELERIEEERYARSRPRDIAETKVRLARESERARRIAEAAARLARETERAKNIAEATSRLAGESAKSAPQGPKPSPFGSQGRKLPGIEPASHAPSQLPRRRPSPPPEPVARSRAAGGCPHGLDGANCAYCNPGRFRPPIKTRGYGRSR